MLERWRAQLPELPSARRERYVREFGLSAYDAGVLTEERETAQFFEAVAAVERQSEAAANWMMGDVRRVLQEHELTLAQAKVRPQQLATLIALVADGTISGKAAKEVSSRSSSREADPADVVDRAGPGAGRPTRPQSPRSSTGARGQRRIRRVVQGAARRRRSSSSSAR